MVKYAVVVGITPNCLVMGVVNIWVWHGRDHQLMVGVAIIPDDTSKKLEPDVCY